MNRLDRNIRGSIIDGYRRRRVPPVFRCPVCREALDEELARFTCANGHAFDRARAGYVNLVPGGRLKGRSSGDDETMVVARRTIFDAGLYDPIIDAVASTVAAEHPLFVLDAGCGEGAYLANSCRPIDAMGWGIDISKSAVRHAAQRYRDMRFAIASSYQLPFADDMFDVVINVFSPRDFAEMFRVLRPGGAAVVVTPGPEHLHQLKAVLYDSPRPHDPEPTGSNLVPESARHVRFDRALGDPELRTSLLQMTPYWWSSTPQRRGAVAMEAVSVTVDMVLAVYRRSD